MSKVVQIGSKYTLGFRKALATPQGHLRSFIHDLPLKMDPAARAVDMVVEIPRLEQGKFEISKDTPANPIVQDTKKGALRFLNNIFPFAGYPVNYGALPQTWEDPTLAVKVDAATLYGDNDPLDVCEISSDVHAVGDIKRVKILGCLAMIDDGELDWKMLAVSHAHPLAHKLNTPEDVEKELPGLLTALKTWLQDYKRPMGKPKNTFGRETEGLDGWLGPQQAWAVVEECHERWALLVEGKMKHNEKLPNITNWTLKGTPGYVGETQTVEAAPEPDSPIPAAAQDIFYYKH